jgi:hypothetical protein
MDAASLEATLNSMATWFTITYYITYVLVSVVTYILTALSLHTIAERRFFTGRCSWLAWIPFAQFWVLARISDDYQWAVRNRKKKKRIVMLALNITQLIAALLIGLCLFQIIRAFLNVGVTNVQGAVNMLQRIQRLMNDQWDVMFLSYQEKILPDVFRINTVLIIFYLLVISVTAVTHVVYFYMAWYDLYRSCNPDDAKVFLVLSILFAITIPIFLMICRKQDKGWL